MKLLQSLSLSTVALGLLVCSSALAQQRPPQGGRPGGYPPPPPYSHYPNPGQNPNPVHYPDHNPGYPQHRPGPGPVYGPVGQHYPNPTGYHPPPNYPSYPGPAHYPYPNQGGYYPPGRPGSYYPPVVYRPGPVFNLPTYPVYNNFPSGPCTVYSHRYSDGEAFYSVTNAYGHVIGTAYEESRAYEIAQNALYSGSCSYIISQNNSYSQPNYCQIQPANDMNGGTYYNVVDYRGNFIRASCSYQEALDVIQNTSQCFNQ